MLIHLDTNYLIGFTKPESPERVRVRAWLERGDRVAASSIAWCEYLCGPLADDEAVAPRHLIGMPQPFLDADAELAAQLYNASGRRRGSQADCQIAAVALRLGAAMATGNTDDFRRFDAFGLRLAD